MEYYALFKKYPRLYNNPNLNMATILDTWIGIIMNANGNQSGGGNDLSEICFKLNHTGMN